MIVRSRATRNTLKKEETIIRMIVVVDGDVDADFGGSWSSRLLGELSTSLASTGRDSDEYSLVDLSAGEVISSRYVHCGNVLFE
jgi:hypothetical protein